MRISNVLMAALFMVATLFPFASAIAQEAEQPNVKKELKSVLKELPPEMQVQVLRFAERKRDAYVAMEAKKAEAAARAEAAKKEVAANPTPPAKQAQPTQPAQPHNHQQAVELAPQRTATAATPTAPAQPNYMQEAQSMPATTVQWSEEEFDFGKIDEGSIAKHTYKITNTGSEPLKLTRVKASCGCTTPKWSKEPIAPGEQGIIEVNFNSRGKSGFQRKSVTVTGNFEGINKVLRFKGEVVKKPAGTSDGNK